MLKVLERECLDLSETIEHLSEKQELLATLKEGKMSLQTVAPEKLQEKIFQEKKRRERTEEALELLGRTHKLWKIRK